MLKITCFIILFAIASIANSQCSVDIKQESTAGNFSYIAFNSSNADNIAISRFALSVNPLGFVQFGPLFNIEVGLTNNLALNGHYRVSPLGLLTYVVHYNEDGLDEFSGYAFGGGFIYFFGERRNKPYFGFLAEYDKAVVLYASGDPWEWEKTTKSVVFICNGGYRFRFQGGFFINLGALVGAASAKYNWDYIDPTYVGSSHNPKSGKDIIPFGMLEVTLGIEF